MRVGILFLFPVGLALAQPQRFDQYTYQAPAGYTSQAGTGRITWTRIDQTRKFYCQIVLFESQRSLGSAPADLAAEWKAVVEPSFETRKEILQRDLPLPAAPESIVRIADTTSKGDKSRVLVSLYVLRFPSRYVGMMQLAPHEQAIEACQADLASLLPSLSFAAPPPAAPATSAAPAVPGTLTGVWQRVQASQVATRYNTITQQWETDPVAALNQFRHTYRYTFQPDGQYVSDIELDNFSRYRRDRIWERGRYSVSGGTIQFQPQEYKKGGSDRRTETVLSPAPAPAPYALRFILGPHPQYGNIGLHIQDANGAWGSFSAPR